MNIKMMIPFFIILGIYITLSYYIGLKAKEIFLSKVTEFKNKRDNIIYWIIYWLIAFSFILSNILRGILSNDNVISLFVTVIGAIYIGIFIYSILIFIEIDIIKFILKRINISPSIKHKLRIIYCRGISVFAIIFIIVGYGIWNARNQVLTNYNININKQAGSITSLNAVMISDVHMGILTREADITKMVKSINELNPDIVLFAGDIFDENTSKNLKEFSRESFKNIKSKYGVFAITGNHEYGAGELTETISYFKDADIQFLRDEPIKVADSFYIVGRNDPANIRVTGEERKSLEDILSETDKSLPIIVLNHRPEDLEEAENAGVDLQLSGHTHKGQIFPGNLVTGYLNEKDYGYLKKGDFNLIVSSGYGTWGPPMRIGSKSELVEINIEFGKY